MDMEGELMVTMVNKAVSAITTRLQSKSLLTMMVIIKVKDFFRSNLRFHIPFFERFFMPWHCFEKNLFGEIRDISVFNIMWHWVLYRLGK